MSRTVTKPTQALIAKELHLSRNTVSKVLNGLPGITEATRKRVLDKAAELNYHHPVVAHEQQAVPEDQNKLNYDIAFLCHADTFTGSFWAEVMKSMERYLDKFHCTTRFVVILPEYEEFLTYPTTLLSKSPDGIVMAGVFDSSYYKHIAALSLPLLSYDTAPGLFANNQLCDVVMVENTAATYTLTEALIHKGHNRIAFAGDRDSCQSFYERWQGYHQAMADNGKPELLLDFKYTTEYYSTADFSRQLSGLKELPTAFVCANDSIAHSAYMLCFPPYQIYRDLDVTGFDNTRAFIASIPHCSTVDIRLDELGQALGESILWRIQNPHHVCRCLRLTTRPILE